MDLRARVRRTFGAELAAALVEAAGADGDTRFEALLAPPRLARNDATRQMWFLNGRPVRDKVLLRVLREAYRGFIPDGRQPVAFVSLSIDPAKVDVNVHPAKSEVRFRDEKRLFGFLVARLRDALRATDMATPGERLIELAGRREAGATLHPGQRELLLPRAGAPYAPSALERSAPPEPQLVRESPPPSSPPRADPDPLRGPFLQIAKTYIVRALPDGFEIVDQHALHERLTLELLREELERGRVEVQRRLVPDQVEVGAAAVELLEPHFEALERIGFLLSRFGAGTVAVHGLPARLRKPEPEALVREIVAAIESSGDAPKADELLESILHRAACRSSVMAGDELSEIEMRALLARARDTSHDQTCAHGRPTRVQFTLADLEKAFHRR
jgi:DNA mismatch repair protein MutL